MTKTKMKRPDDLADLMKFEPQRRYATLVALAVEGTAMPSNEQLLRNQAERQSISQLPTDPEGQSAPRVEK